MKEKMTITDYILKALQLEDVLTANQITRMVSAFTGREMKIQDIASILSKLVSRTDMQFFMIRDKTTSGHVYSLRPAAKDLGLAQMSDLTRKTGRNRYTLQQAVKDFPALNEFVPASRWAVPEKKNPDTKTSPAGSKPIAYARGKDEIAVRLGGMQHIMTTHGAIKLFRTLETAISASL